MIIWTEAIWRLHMRVILPYTFVISVSISLIGITTLFLYKLFGKWKRAECDSDHPVVSTESVTSKSVVLKWKEPVKNLDVSEVQFRPLTLNTDNCDCTLSGLKPNTKYEFEVLHTGSDGHRLVCQEPPISITTLASAAHDIKERSVKICNGLPSFYKIPLEPDGPPKSVGKLINIKKQVFGEINGKITEEKTILIFGPRGNYTRAVVDGIINFIFDVSADDDFRFSVGNEFDKFDEDERTNQGKNDKECVNYIKVIPTVKCKVPFTMNIICAQPSIQSSDIEQFSKDLQNFGIGFLNSIWFCTADSIQSTFGINLGNYECVFNTSLDETKEKACIHSIKSYHCSKRSSHVVPSNLSTCSRQKDLCLLFCMEQNCFETVFDQLKTSVEKPMNIAVKVHLLQKNFNMKVKDYEIAMRKVNKKTVNYCISKEISRMNELNEKKPLFFPFKSVKKFDQSRNSNVLSPSEALEKYENAFVLKKDKTTGSIHCTYCKRCNSICHKPCKKDLGKHCEVYDWTTRTCKICKCKIEDHLQGEFLPFEIPDLEDAKSAYKRIQELENDIKTKYIELKEQSWLLNPQHGFSFRVIMLEFGHPAELGYEDQRFSNLQQPIQPLIAKLFEKLISLTV